MILLLDKGNILDIAFFILNGEIAIWSKIEYRIFSLTHSRSEHENSVNKNVDNVKIMMCIYKTSTVCRDELS